MTARPNSDAAGATGGKKGYGAGGERKRSRRRRVPKRRKRRAEASWMYLGGQ